MTEITVTLTNPSGLHARPASALVQAAARFKSRVVIKAAGKTADAKSILMVMGLALKQGAEITVTAEGEDEQACIEELKALFEKNFGE